MAISSPFNRQTGTFGAYQQQERMGNAYAPTNKPISVRPDNSGAIALARAQGEGGTNLFKILGDANDKWKKASRLRAVNRYNELIAEGYTDLLLTKEQGAENIIERYDKLHKEAYDKAFKENRAALAYTDEGTDFKYFVDRDNVSHRETIVRHHVAEMDNFYETETQNALDISRKVASDGGYTIASMDAGINRITETCQMRYGKYGGDKVAVETRKATAKLVGDAVQYAINTDDWTKMGEITAVYGQYMKPEARIQLKSLMDNRQKEARESDEVETLWKSFGGETGVETLTIEDIEKALEPRKQYGVQPSESYAPTYDMPVESDRIREQVNNLKSGWQEAIPRIGGTLKHVFGIEDAEITSGARSAERQRQIYLEAGKEPIMTSHHIDHGDGGDALDVYVGDLSEEQADKLLKHFKSSGAFEEVLFHDMGLGAHLHLGGYKGGYKGAATQRNGGTVERFMAGLAQQESGGDYESINEDSGAFGAYQIMPDNWPVWAEEAGLDRDAPKTKENQDHVARFKLLQYYEMFGNWHDVAIAWYGGPGAVDYSEEAKNAPQWYSGQEYPSINSYAGNVVKLMGGVNDGIAYAGNSQLADLARRQRAEKIYEEFQKRLARARVRRNTIIQNASLQIQDLQNQGVIDPSAVRSIAIQAAMQPDGTIDDKIRIPLEKEAVSLQRIIDNEAKKKAKEGSGSGSGSGSSKKDSDPFAEQTVIKWLEEGQGDEWIFNQIADNNWSNGTSLVKLVRQYRQGQGEFANTEMWSSHKESLKREVANLPEGTFNELFYQARHYAWRRMQQYAAEHNGAPMPYPQVHALLLEGMQDKPTVYDGTRGAYSGNYNTVTLPKTIGELNELGVDNIRYNPRNHNYDITLIGKDPNRGGTFSATKEQFERIVYDNEDAWAVLFGYSKDPYGLRRFDDGGEDEE